MVPAKTVTHAMPSRRKNGELTNMTNRIIVRPEGPVLWIVRIDNRRDVYGG
jgi:hypothetical protein